MEGNWFFFKFSVQLFKTRSKNVVFMNRGGGLGGGGNCMRVGWGWRVRLDEVNF